MLIDLSRLQLNGPAEMTVEGIKFCGEYVNGQLRVREITMTEDVIVNLIFDRLKHFGLYPDGVEKAQHIYSGDYDTRHYNGTVITFRS